MNIYSDYKKITLTGTETEIKFQRNYPVFGVKGENITVALTAGAVSDTRSTADTDGVVMWAHKENIDTMYLTGTGDVIVWAGDRAEECPFKTGGKGGGGGSGGGCTYRGTTTTAISNGSTTNPITIDGESYTAVFGDVVVYGYTEFVFDGTAWSEFGRPFDTVPTSGSTNAVTSDGVYRNTAGQKYYVNNVYKGEVFNGYVNNVASGDYSHAEGYYTTASRSTSHAEGDHTTASGNSSHAEGYRTVASGHSSHAGGYYTIADQMASTAIGKYNVADTDVTHLFIVGNGTSSSSRSNILEVSETDVNVNGDIQRDGVGIDDYTTTERKIGKWIDGSDLYQRTFEVTGLTQGEWNNALGTSDIDIKAFDGYIRYLYNGEFNRNISLNYYINSTDYVATQNAGSDLSIKPNRTESGIAIDKAVITIKYTKPSVQADTLNTNIQQTEEPTDEMR
jgi:hypothetical protein